MKKKIMVIGGTGTIGRAAVKELVQRHTVISVGHQRGDSQVDIADYASIERLFQTIGKIDAVVITTGQVCFADLANMTAANYWVGLNSKLMGQVNVVLIGEKYMNDGGSFTLTSGILNHDPIRSGSSAAMVNGAIDGFVKSAAVEMPRGIRINSVSPTVVTESLPLYGNYFLGFNTVPAATVALSYSKSVEGLQTGQIYRAGY